ncbi:MAG TPA: hypothetical protein VJ741_13615, partial [Solirubrobacteraceae bacterium]|nr:hypothetical protein [Solirubrobacteraceae bacterium]
LEPRPAAYPPTTGAYRPDGAHPRAPSRSRAGRRFVAFLAVVLLFVAAVAAAVAIAASSSNSAVHFRRVVAHDTNSAVQKFQDLVNQYTK